MENMVNIPAENPATDSSRAHVPSANEVELAELRSAGAISATHLGWLPGTPSSSIFTQRCSLLRSSFDPLFAGIDAAFTASPDNDDLRWLRDNVHLLFSELYAVWADLKPMKRLPHVRNRRGVVIPRGLALADGVLV